MTCATNRVVGETRTGRVGSTVSRRSSASYFVYLVLLVTLFDLGQALSRDGLHLLDFKERITHDYCNALADWNEADSHPCNWRGVICDGSSLRVISLNIDGRQAEQGARNRLFSRPNRVVNRADNDTASVARLVSSIDGSAVPSSWNSWGIRTQGEFADVGRCALSGTLSPAIGNLSELRILSIAHNNFTGGIPRELANLEFLETLDLQSNSLSGKLPGEFGRLQNLQVLNLNNNGLEGHIPAELSSCSKLRTLSLSENEFSGTLPLFLGSLERLEWLALSSNRLLGTIPMELTGSMCKLIFLDLSRNGFTGSIPSELGNCGRLRWVILNSNSFSGRIPPELGRLSRLKYLHVAFNHLSGLIPTQLAECQRLEVLVLSSQNVCRSSVDDTPGCSSRSTVRGGAGENNYFEGPLPQSIGSLPGLRVLWAPGVGLSGSFPREWGGCSNLEVLNLAQNAFSGVLVEGLSNCKNLIYLDLSSNQLTGRFPSKVAVKCMVVFNVSRNLLSGTLPDVSSRECAKPVPRKDTSNLITRFLLQSDTLNRESLICNQFLHTGTRAKRVLSPRSCQTKVVHDWSLNRFTGSIPFSVLGVFMSGKDSVYSFSVAGNQLTGTLSPHLFEVCKKAGGLSLDFSDNMLTGVLPSAGLGSCTSLVEFLAARNFLSGEIPHELGEVKRLAHLDLTRNCLEGNLPDDLGKLRSLKVLLLAQNKLRGSLPSVLGNVESLQVLDLSQNDFSGSLPEDLSFLGQLQKLYLNNNRFSGVIPADFSNLSSLEDVNFSCNNWSGLGPRLRNVDFLCRHGLFTGTPVVQVCRESSDMSRRVLYSPYREGDYWYHASVSSRSVKGERVLLELSSEEGEAFQVVHDSNNETLEPSQVPPGLFAGQNKRLNSILIAAITSGCAIALVLLVLGVLFQCTRQRSPTSHCPTPGRKEVVTFMSTPYHMTYENVVRATGNFSIDNLIGNGGFGATYKAELRPGFLVAVKRLAIGRFQGVQQFDTEIRTLGTIRHPNLVTLIGYHASQDEMFLIYNYFPQGNLETLIHSSRGDMDWHIRHSIALRIAEALAYLHDECVPRVLHRDIKPSNILLDDNLNAHLSDFGLARLLGTSETHATTDVAGTFGYVAPEYAMTCRVTDKADVYSYGVVLLELLSNKRALGDPCFFEYGDNFNIVSWACLLIRQGREHEVFTVGLWEQGPEDTLLETLRLAVLCTVDSLSIRPTMKEVVSVLKKLQPSPSTS